MPRRPNGRAGTPYGSPAYALDGRGGSRHTGRSGHRARHTVYASLAAAGTPSVSVPWGASHGKETVITINELVDYV
ncbi:hypothetical protein GCM10009679_12360 [Saccharothrix algeriensis]|uniref:Uncharacterized protein n=1 Tax=Catellatospora bangladeshensis TaxID=310355 RepID=A0A8J3JNY9_9ACTN|nr:hypothetical protein Cba03nite_26530 [Catellatospora bangladeshensis]